MLTSALLTPGQRKIKKNLETLLLKVESQSFKKMLFCGKSYQNNQDHIQSISRVWGGVNSTIFSNLFWIDEFHLETGPS